MIQAKELRIGNYVKLNGRVMKPNAELMSLIITGETIDPMPILLTTEILEKCGFGKGTYDGDIKYFLKLRNGITSYEFAFFPNTDLGNGYSAAILLHKNDMIGGNIYYLHQIQNLYYALTGEELIVNL